MKGVTMSQEEPTVTNYLLTEEQANELREQAISQYVSAPQYEQQIKKITLLRDFVDSRK